jgi:hypothetical protein
MHHGSKQHNANKISVVKHKHGNPNWHNQQGSNQQQQQKQQQQGSDGQAKCKHGKCTGKGKAKAADQSQQHSHITNIASIAPPTTSTIVLPALSGMQKHTITCPTSKQHMPGPYKAFNPSGKCVTRGRGMMNYIEYSIRLKMWSILLSKNESYHAG